MSPKKKSVSLSKKNPDVVFLRQLMESGDVTGETDAKAVYDSYSRFNNKYKLKNFRVCFNNLCNELGLERASKGKPFIEVFHVLSMF